MTESERALAAMRLAAIVESADSAIAAQNERRFSDSMIESMPGVLYFYDETGRFLRWNRNFEVVTGYSTAEVAEMTPLDFFAPEHRPLLEERIGAVFTRGEAHVQAPLLAKDGSTTPYFFTGKRVVFNGAVCLVGVGIDVSDREQAQAALAKSEQRYRSTLDNILEGCQLLDFDWRYLYLNEAAARQNRRPNIELLGHRMPDMWPGIEATGVFAMLRRCMVERGALHQETEFEFPDGRKGWFDVRVQPVPEGIFVLSIDISERKRAERALQELNESLEAKVKERTIDLDAARQRAEVADRLKSAFLATMSHELRTPLNSIIGFTGIVLQELAGPLTPEQRKQLGMVRGSARHLLELINDVLDLSKIEADQLEIVAAPFEPELSIERVVNSVRPLADKKGLTVVASIDPALGDRQMISDRRRVEQILLNVISNAIKFSERGTVTVRAARAQGWASAVPTTATRPALQVRVEDTGIGIKPEDLATLFQPFRQIDSGLSRQHEGTGLGLAICRRLATLLGGDISASSEFGRGSTFTVTLPLDGP